VSSGLRALRAKRRKGAHHHPWDLGLAALLTSAGVLMAIYGIVERMPLFVALATIGVLNGISQLRYWLRAPTSPMHWWYEHMSGMLVSCIAAVTAFLVTNAGRLHLPRTSLLLWLAPGIVGGLGIGLWKRYYRRKFAGRAATVAG
jgi:uncharacterized membrane protein HdeD (DUF308 family)